MIGRIWRMITGRKNRSGDILASYDPAKNIEESLVTGGDLSLGVVDFGRVTICGNYREHNEDNLFTSDLASNLSLFVVADGMGGQLGGEYASQIAVDVIPREVQKRNVGEFRTVHVIKAIRESVSAANSQIIAASMIQPQLSNMGTTVVLAIIRRGRAYVSGIGDSRCYRVRAGRAELLTRDHSMAQALAEVGTIRQEDVPTHRYNHVLYLYLGSREVDRGVTDVKVLSLLDGDRFVLCSDGLSGSLSDVEMVKILKEEPNAQKASEQLVDKAVVNRSRDNITCVVLNIGRVEQPTSDVQPASVTVEHQSAAH